MKLRYSARAHAHLLAIEEYLRSEADPDVTKRIGSRIRESLEILSHFPHAGRPGKVAGTREWLVRQFPYVIVYELPQGKRDEILILGVFHCRQDRP